ncbi:MAG: serine/threonine protein kinase [Rhizobacter sp.]|nr:serine/threonine protein kinase [Rhizobacter sp.]
MSTVHELEAVRAPAVPAHLLPPGTRLREYEIKGVIGESACSIVYLGWDHALQRRVAVKEYMPAALAGRLPGTTNVVVGSDRHLEAVRAGMRAFLNEARVLARFDHPALVKVYRFWEDNGTAYVAMPYYEGPTLKSTLAELGHVPSESELRAWLKPILNGVSLLHEGGVWHQNIGPDEILMTPFGPVLLGFAAAAHAIQAMRHTPAAALKPGYAAIEQYGSAAGTTRGPWTDLYAIGALIYSAITGNDPPPAADRLSDDRMRPLAVVASGLYSDRFLAAVDAAMAVQPRRRPTEHAEFRALMGDIEAPEKVSLATAPDLMQEPFIGERPARGTEVTVPDPPPLATAPSAAPTTSIATARERAPAKHTPSSPDGDDASPSWMRQTAHARAIGKRALYGLVAGTFTLIGLAALVLQFATRPAPRVPAAAPGARTVAAASSDSRAAAPAASAMTAAATTTVATTPFAHAQGTASAAARTSRPPPVAKATTSSAATASTTAAASAPIVVSSPLELQARCTEILQKASLEKITPAETDFFKRECK